MKIVSILFLVISGCLLPALGLWRATRRTGPRLDEQGNVRSLSREQGEDLEAAADGELVGLDHDLVLARTELLDDTGAQRLAVVVDELDGVLVDGAVAVVVDDDLGGDLTLLHGDPRERIPELAERVGASSVHVTRETTPSGAARDRVVAERLEGADLGWGDVADAFAALVPGGGAPSAGPGRARD